MPAELGEVTGRATAIDATKLKVGGQVFRLFGIVAPRASDFGAQDSYQALVRVLASRDTRCVPMARSWEGLPVARCFVGQGDVSRQLVAGGYARDCPRQSGSAYEPAERYQPPGPAAWTPLPGDC
ncbi:hypothetical protein [Roseiterribacter gracilis]|uniref:TNase-like domain-containing protein n=1 Tax=Roseiterribacter gracilis TaxID=2812848 RepID=A0A8S8X9R9_9PROT|nr:hypothetical protein TMPK1_03140 [Rhodospirillales bacterium TMPK1]